MASRTGDDSGESESLRLARSGATLLRSGGAGGPRGATLRCARASEGEERGEVDMTTAVGYVWRREGSWWEIEESVGMARQFRRTAGWSAARHALARRVGSA